MSAASAKAANFLPIDALHACRRQNLERQVVAVESALEQKLTEQKANVVGATSKGVSRLLYSFPMLECLVAIFCKGTIGMSFSQAATWIWTRPFGCALHCPALDVSRMTGYTSAGSSQGTGAGSASEGALRQIGAGAEGGCPTDLTSGQVALGLDGCELSESNSVNERVSKDRSFRSPQNLRAEILEKAKAQAARQSISKAANELDAAVNQRLNAW
eukprot:483610-Pelagomonas_calceolata.AAC.1